MTIYLVWKASKGIKTGQMVEAESSFTARDWMRSFDRGDMVDYCARALDYRDGEMGYWQDAKETIWVSVCQAPRSANYEALVYADLFKTMADADLERQIANIDIEIARLPYASLMVNIESKGRALRTERAYFAAEIEKRKAVA